MKLPDTTFLLLQMAEGGDQLKNRPKMYDSVQLDVVLHISVPKSDRHLKDLYTAIFNDILKLV